ncbi:PAS domain S-box protein [Salinadaptatus halalkaliphilus]|uniref:histidine kinase n=1 Tax=Salinadaptatus halalkaliphilus TaxID=2419781 RepID=A0A4S3TN77_9EURY|nr:ATP-binding protein [Salinadaptatus halalkaliphilus]THE64663.1 PAS domain S-box protein [Salinadaptatus halalkaliphilus]
MGRESAAGDSTGVACGFETDLEPGRFRHLIEHIQDAVVEFEFVDGEPIVRGINPAFSEVFGYEPDEIVGQSLNAYIVPTWLEGESTTLDDRTQGGKVNYRHVRRETTDGIREFLYRGIPYETAAGVERGFAVYTDLTEDRRNRSRIDVLNRVLRHNLRNQVTLVAGSLDGLFETLDTDALEPRERQLVETARTGIDDLETLSQEASELYRILNTSVPTDATVDCVPLIRSVAGTFGKRYPEASITLEVPDTLWVTGTDRLEVALSSLLENAIEHNPASEPRVWLEAGTDTEGWCYLTVADDGPGIPAVEREVRTGDAEITELRHGSGLGLWLVTWIVEGFGGELSFERSRADGARVRLRLRRCRGTR